jgi:predicted RNA-binding Zn ribbon-like protein
VELTDATARTDRGPQPGDRRPAPGDLELVQTFLNSRWDLTSRNEEELVSPGAVSTWLVEHGLVDRRYALTASDHSRVLDVREGLRTMLFVNNGASEDPEVVAGLNRALRAPRIYVQLAVADSPVFKPQPRDLDGALALIATIVALSQLDGSWSRMKACRGHDCGWAFYDHSRNQASNWCAMSVCGSRAKVRAYRKRRRGPEAA